MRAFRSIKNANYLLDIHIYKVLRIQISTVKNKRDCQLTIENENVFEPRTESQGIKIFSFAKSF